LVLSAQSLCPDILGMLNLSQPFGLGADPLAVDLRPRLNLVGGGGHGLCLSWLGKPTVALTPAMWCVCSASQNYETENSHLTAQTVVLGAHFVISSPASVFADMRHSAQRPAAIESSVSSTAPH
jgi:hypothetical protein